MSDLKKTTAKGLAWGGVFSLIQQVLGLLFGIVIARILSPSDYGMVGMLSIFSVLASVLQESGFVFVLTNRESVSKSEYSTAFWFNILMSVSVYLVLYISAPYLAAYFNNEQLISLSRYVFLGFVISSFGIVQSAYLYKQMRVKERGIATTAGGIFAGVLGIVLAKHGWHYWGLATQMLASTLISTVILWIYSPFRPLLIIDKVFLREVLPEGIKYAVPNFVVAISGNIYSLILGKYYTVSDVGFFSQATKFNTYGYSVTLGMVRNVSQPMLVQLRDHKEERLKAFRKMVRFCAFLSFPTMFCLAFVAPELVSLVLTDKWLDTAYILRILCIGGAFTTLSTLFTYDIISQNKASLYMLLGVCSSVLKIVLAIIASFWGILSLAFVCAFLDVLSVFVYYGFTKNNSGYSVIELVEDVMPVFVAVVAIIALAYFVTLGISNLLLLLLMRICIVTVLFLISMHLLHLDIYEEGVNLIGKRFKVHF